MYKVLIIDDETLIAKGLESKIDWLGMECQVCGVAHNGIEGKRLINEVKPDIVISDIVMPGMNGLELAEYIYLYHKGMITIILTAYDEFQYAQQAIKYGVTEYILKPIDKNEIVKAVKSAIIKLKQKESSVKNIHKLETIVKKVKPIITNTVLFDIALNGNHEIAHTESQLKYLDIDIGKGAVIIIKMNAKQQQPFNKLHFFATKNSIHNVFINYKYEYVVKEKDEQYIILAKFDKVITDNVVKNRLIEICRAIRACIQDNVGIDVSIGIGGCYHNIYEIHLSYRDAVRAVNDVFFKEYSHIIHIDEVEQIEERNYFFSWHDELYQKIREGTQAQALEALEKIFFNLQEIRDEQYVKGICLNIVRQLNMMLFYEDRDKDEQEQFEVQKVKRALFFIQLKEYLQECVAKSCHAVKQRYGSTKNSIVNSALKIIHEEYSDKKLSLQSVANQLNISFPYLSRLFKKEVKMTFMDYVTDIRISKAKELLKNSALKNNEIADKVGFYDSRYFSQVFKKKCHMTPTKYRQEYGKSKN